MFQRDYILRMIEAITNVMARYLKLKAQEKHQEALVLLEEFYSKLMLPPSKLLLKMSDQELLSLVSMSGEVDLDKTVGLALLLKEEGRVHEDLGHHAESSIRFTKSLFLFITAALRGADVPGMDPAKAIEELRALLRTYRIPAETLRQLRVHYERLGQYAAAEDVLFELLEEEHTLKALQEGEWFYERVLKAEDEALEAGNLPRHEAEQGREEILRRMAALQHSR